MAHVTCSPNYLGECCSHLPHHPPMLCCGFRAKKRVILHSHSTAVAVGTFTLTDDYALIPRLLSSFTSCSRTKWPNPGHGLRRVVLPLSAFFILEKFPHLSLTFMTLMLLKTASGVLGDVALDFGWSGGSLQWHSDYSYLARTSWTQCCVLLVAPRQGPGDFVLPSLLVTLTSIARWRWHLPADSTMK